MDTGKIISLLVPTRLEPFTLIEFPGILESPEHLSNHLEARNILQAVSNREQQVFFWCDKANGKPDLFGTTSACSKLLVRLRVNKKTGGLSGAAVLGRATREVLFRDYQVDGADAGEHFRELRSIHSQCQLGTVEGALKCSDWFAARREEALLFAPAHFSQYESFTDFSWAVHSTTKQSTPIGGRDLERPERENKAPWAIRFSAEGHLLPPQPAEQQTNIPVECMEAIRGCFRDRPVWTSFALSECISPESALYLKKALPLLAYHYRTGPWRRCWVRYGYDAAQEPESCRYQTIEVRSLRIRFSDLQKIAGDKIPAAGQRHLFDGVHLTSNSNLIQLCDVTEPQISQLICNAPITKQAPDAADGWYSEGFIDHLRRLLFGCISRILEQLNWPLHLKREHARPAPREKSAFGQENAQLVVEEFSQEEPFELFE